MHLPHPAVRFSNPRKAAAARRGPLEEEIERFAAADPRWRFAIEMAAARLSPPAQSTLGVALSGLEAGPAPRLMPFDFGPDDEDAVERERGQMAPRLLSGLALLTPERLGLQAREIALVHGVVTAIHRLLRVAKTRP